MSMDRRAQSMKPISQSILALLGGSLIAAAFQCALADEDFVTRSHILQDQGDIKGAVTTLKEGVSLDPDNAQARYLLSMPNGTNGDWKTAESLLREAQGLAPGHLPSGLALARLLLQQGKRDEAKALLDTLAAARNELAAALASKAGFPEREQAEALLRVTE